MIVREARREDAPAMAAAWRDAGRFYVAISPDDFRVPEQRGLVDWLECGVEAMTTDKDLALLVAERDGTVVGWVAARLVQPVADAPWQLQRELATTRLIIDAVAVAEPHRGAGTGIGLVRAAEAWGRERGASVAVADGNWASGMVQRFYEARLGYRRRSVSLRKAL
ncbi:MAG TPA: GNAT family N-acetyltransferase [Solirubrobacteraceae bacterium]|nr:GNAT family N-acetyltransferase [Solirubrobacteraceae bacterium]